jgi:catechol-2,3-dioxygenase
MQATSAQAETPPLDDRAVFKPVIHHVNLKTTRLDEMVDWYGLTVGLEVNFRNQLVAFLTNDAANHRLALLAVPGLKHDRERITRDGMHHLAFEYPSLDELLGTYLRLATRGILPHACLDHGMTMSLYYLDPDGNSVELQADNYGDWVASSEFMRTDPRFTEDPIGKPVDPGALVAARQAGTNPRQLHERAYAGEFGANAPIDLRLPPPPAV